jgi:hypothetical protein
MREVQDCEALLRDLPNSFMQTVFGVWTPTISAQLEFDTVSKFNVPCAPATCAKVKASGIFQSWDKGGDEVFQKRTHHGRWQFR